MTTLLVIGAGGHGKVVADAALSTQRWKEIVFIDDRGAQLGSPLGFPVIGLSSDLERVASRFMTAALGIGDARVRLEFLQRCQEAGLRLDPIVHARAAVSAYASLGAGTVVFAQAAVNADAVLGQACIVNTGATVGHDCVIGDGAHVCPGTNIAGNVHIGMRTWVGVGSCVRQCVTIGRDVTVGAGSVVVSDVEPGVTVMGVPAKIRVLGSRNPCSLRAVVMS